MGEDDLIRQQTHEFTCILIAKAQSASHWMSPGWPDAAALCSTHEHLQGS